MYIYTLNMLSMNNARSLPIQAQAVLFIGAISVAYLVVQMLGLRSGNKKNFSAMVLGASVLAVVVSTYNINCLISGSCNKWATLLAVAYVLTQGSALLQVI
jgi:hypothetical protein